MRNKNDVRMKSKRGQNMLFPTLFMGALALAVSVVAFRQGQLVEGGRVSWHMAVEIFPLLVFALILAGMTQVIIPQQLVTEWVGENAGMKGILVGAVAGGFCPGGPYTKLRRNCDF